MLQEREDERAGALRHAPCFPAEDDDAFASVSDNPSHVRGCASDLCSRTRNAQVGGTIFHSFKGARNAPRGERMAGAVEAVKANARRLGGSFAVWGGLFSTFDCCLIAIRNKEDPYNSIVSSDAVFAPLCACLAA